MKCSRCHHELTPEVEACLNCDTLANPTPVHYFYTPPGRLLFFYLISLGLYGPYWFYKNTAAIKKAKGNNRSFFWKVLLGVILIGYMISIERLYIMKLLSRFSWDSSGGTFFFVGGFTFLTFCNLRWVIPFGHTGIDSIYRNAEKYGYPIRSSYVAEGAFAISYTLIFLNLLLCALVFVAWKVGLRDRAGFISIEFIFIFFGLLAVAFIHLSTAILMCGTILITQRAIKFHNNQVGYTNKRPLSRGEKVLLAPYLLWLLLISAYKINAAIMNQRWKTFHPPHHTFQVILPGIPDEQDLNRKIPIVIGDKNLTAYRDIYGAKDSSGSTIYYIGVVQSSSGLPLFFGLKQLLLHLIGGDAKYLESRFTKWGGFPAHDFIIEESGQCWHGRVIAVDKKWYWLIAEYTQSPTQRQKKDYNKFIDSFELKDKQ